MGPPDLVRFRRLGQPVPGVIADRGQQVVARVTAGVLHPEQRFVRQPAQQLQHRVRADVSAGGHPFGRIQRETAVEHGQPAEDGPLGRLEHVVAPVQRRAQRLVPARRGARPADQHREDVAQPLGELRGGKHPHPGRRQLDRQRQPVEPLADRQDLGGVLVGDAKGRPHQLRPLLEQHDRVGVGEQRRGRRRPGLRQRQRRYVPVQLAVYAEGLAARGQDDQGGTGGEQVLGQAGRGLGKVLAVVEDDEHRVVGHVLGHRLDGLLARGIGHAEPGGDRPRDDARVFDRGQLHPAGAGGERGAGGAGGGQRQAGLSGAAGPGEGEQPAAGQGSHDLAELALAAHQRSQPYRQLLPGQHGHAPARSSRHNSSSMRRI